MMLNGIAFQKDQNEVVLEMLSDLIEPIEKIEF
jgi:hypothetical protein